MQESNNKRRLKAINRHIIAYLFKFHRLSFTSGAHHFSFARFQWPTLVLCVYLYCACTIALNLYYQYPYDIHKKRLKHFRMFANNSYMRHHHHQYDEVKSEAIIRNLHDLLKSVGAPHLEWSIAVECVYSYILEASFVSFILWPVYINWRQLNMSNLEQFLQDPAKNAQDRRELVRREMYELIRLSKSNARSKMTLSLQNLQPKLRPILSQHQSTCRQLRSIQHSIEPLNRHPARSNLCVYINITVFLLMYGYCTICIVILYLMAQNYYASSAPIEIDSWRDVATLLSAFWLLFTILNSGALIGVMSILVVMDQIEAVLELKRLICKLIERNEWHARQILELGNADMEARENLAANMDHDCLTLMMQIRLFDSDFQETRRHYDSFLAIYIFFTGSLTLITRLLFAYMDSDLKIFAFYLSVPGLIPMFMAILPICFLNSRCLDTYALLSSLVAQLTQFEAQAGVLDGSLNNEFVLKLLRKQLALSERFVDKYATRTLLIDLNYANILRVVFYLSLVLLSILDSTPSINVEIQQTSGEMSSLGDTMFKRFRTDPLGVYQF